MAESKREWVKRFLDWLQDDDLLEYGDEEEMCILAESFCNEHADCPLTFDQLVNGYWER